MKRIRLIRIAPDSSTWIDSLCLHNDCWLLVAAIAVAESQTHPLKIK